ncbi:MAG: putative glycoside hydrolase [Candidatus Colwellbacteria bacterium]|jgi:hypothetical protein|nr:putative glycoside hydrolase [Candidatus Colwellbacteria bacterium]MCK9497281.1 putative glycoside hydrolase [Candidatus Colwellbacteria bacterium]MDD3752638.1 putative glycoside hydrolase [Candidatus Colwellbacteria bacterium]MDD4818713.1 putative glycoside hydrolase [Candidatus Colwellbacteria bacterium]
MKVKKAFLAILCIFFAAAAAFLVFGIDKKHSIIEYGDTRENPSQNGPISENLPAVAGISASQELDSLKVVPSDILVPPSAFIAPEEIKAIYVTQWSASSSAKMSYLTSLIEETEANAMVIDIKDYSGKISYKTGDNEISKYGAEDPKIRDISSLIESLHKKNIYVIARVVVFQDPSFALARPDLAIKNSKTGEIWLDNKELAWMDPSSQEVWDYNIRIAKNALLKGFDEVNFDYIRFPSDGNLGDMSFPIYNETKTKKVIMEEFFSYLRESLKGHIISADIFGLVTSASGDMGIGQNLEDTFGNFDFICPMVYPSHFASGFIGLENPAKFPYEVVKYSMSQAQKRLLLSGKENLSKLRPWIQDFSLRHEYKKEEVASQIQAVLETSNTGWMIWDPANNYTKEGFVKQ